MDNVDSYREGGDLSGDGGEPDKGEDGRVLEWRMGSSQRGRWNLSGRMGTRTGSVGICARWMETNQGRVGD